MLRRRTNLQKIHKNCLWTLCVQTQRNENRKSERKISRPRLKKASVNAENVKLRLKEKKHVSASEKKLHKHSLRKAASGSPSVVFRKQIFRRKSLMYDALESERIVLLQMQRRMFRHVDNNCFICLWSSISELLQPHWSGSPKTQEREAKGSVKDLFMTRYFVSPANLRLFWVICKNFFGDNKKFFVTRDIEVSPEIVRLKDNSRSLISLKLN